MVVGGVKSWHCVWKQRNMQKEGERQVVNKLIRATVTNHCNFDGQSSLYATTQVKAVIWKFLEFRNEKSMSELRSRHSVSQFETCTCLN
jgi:hypothetical protein